MYRLVFHLLLIGSLAFVVPGVALSASALTPGVAPLRMHLFARTDRTRESTQGSAMVHPLRVRLNGRELPLRLVRLQRTRPVLFATNSNQVVRSQSTRLQKVQEDVAIAWRLQRNDRWRPMGYRNGDPALPSRAAHGQENLTHHDSLSDLQQERRNTQRLIASSVRLPMREHVLLHSVARSEPPQTLELPLTESPGMITALDEQVLWGQVGAALAYLADNLSPLDAKGVTSHREAPRMGVRITTGSGAMEMTLANLSSRRPEEPGIPAVSLGLKIGYSYHF